MSTIFDGKRPHGLPEFVRRISLSVLSDEQFSQIGRTYLQEIKGFSDEQVSKFDQGDITVLPQFFSGAKQAYAAFWREISDISPEEYGYRTNRDIAELAEQRDAPIDELLNDIHNAINARIQGAGSRHRDDYLKNQSWLVSKILYPNHFF